MPQDSWLGPLSFLALINDLKPDCFIQKHVDDTTLTELLYGRTKPCSMQSFFHQLLNWTDQNDVVVNLIKTKEMVFGPACIISNLPPISASSYQIQRASEAKLLGLHIESNLSWHTHVKATVSKVCVCVCVCVVSFTHCPDSNAVCRALTLQTIIIPINLFIYQFHHVLLPFICSILLTNYCPDKSFSQLADPR